MGGVILAACQPLHASDFARIEQKLAQFSQVKCAQKGNRRYYTWNGADYPSVTTVLSATKPYKERIALHKWRQRIGEAQAKEIVATACRRGTALHAVLEHYIKGGEVIEEALDEEVRPYWDSIKPFLRTLGAPYLIERLIVNELWGYAGTPDLVADYEGQLTLVDWKTAHKPKKPEHIHDYKLQVVAYAAGVNRVLDWNIRQVVVAVAIPDCEAQIFRLDYSEMVGLWAEWQCRLREYQECQK